MIVEDLDGDKVPRGKFGGALDDEFALARAIFDFDRRAAPEHSGRINREEAVAGREEDALADFACFRDCPRCAPLSEVWP